MRAVIGLLFLLASLLIGIPDAAQAGAGSGPAWTKKIFREQRKEAQKQQAPPKAPKAAAARAGGSDTQRAKPVVTGGGGFEVSASTGGGGLDYEAARRADATDAVIKAAAQ